MVRSALALFLVGCGAAPIAPTSDERAQLERDGAHVLRCDEALSIEPATFDLEEVCVEAGHTSAAGDDVLSRLAGEATCARFERRHTPLGEPAWHVVGCEREAVMACGRCPSGPLFCAPLREFHAIECTTYVRG